MPAGDEVTRPGAHRAPGRTRTPFLAALISILMTAIAGIVVLGVVSSSSGPVGATVTDDGDSSLAQARLNTLSVPDKPADEPAEADTTATDAIVRLPDHNGSGKRIVFDQDSQRVWLVESDNTVARTYLVSGSRLANLAAGKYQVKAKYPNVLAYDGSGTMGYFVEFAHGNTAAIGFHDIPSDRKGDAKQNRSQLGTPTSDGCVRQWKDDAVALWKFAKVGTRVVVTS